MFFPPIILTIENMEQIKNILQGMFPTTVKLLLITILTATACML